jgi:hypothetical protein
LATRPHWLAQMSVGRRIMIFWHRGCVFTSQTNDVSKVIINQAKTKTSVWLSFHTPAIRLCHSVRSASLGSRVSGADSTMGMVSADCKIFSSSGEPLAENSDRLDRRCD